MSRRVTKADLSRQLESAKRFARMPIVFAKPADEPRIRDTCGFVHACCYAGGTFAMEGELGHDQERRYIIGKPIKYRPIIRSSPRSPT